MTQYASNNCIHESANDAYIHQGIGAHVHSIFHCYERTAVLGSCSKFSSPLDILLAGILSLSSEHAMRNQAPNFTRIVQGCEAST